jgi:guanylate kinase
MEAELAQLISSYRPSATTIDMVKRTSIVLLAGVSGAGKDTIIHHLLETGDYHPIVSHTTRPPRVNAGVPEQDGREYHFIDQLAAAKMLASGEFVEAKFVHGDTIYGTSAAEVERAGANGQVALNDIEIQGIAEYKAISDNVVAIFVLPPSFDEWQRRLRARYSQPAAAQAEILRRMQTAVTELTEATSRSYFHFVINDDLADSIKAVNEIVKGGNNFDAKDTASRQRAQQLLVDLQAELASQSSPSNS